MGQEPEAPATGETPEASADTKIEVKETKTFDEAYVKQLRSEAAQHRIEAQEVKKRLEELEERDASEVEKAQRKATKLEQEAAEAKSKLLRYEVAAEKQIPADALDLLTGNTREELEAKADKLLELVKNRTENTPEPAFDGGAREPAEDPKTPEQQHNSDMLALLFGGTRT